MTRTLALSVLAAIAVVAALPAQQPMSFYDLKTTTLDGKIKARLPGRGGDIREPDWGPFQR